MSKRLQFDWDFFCFQRQNLIAVPLFRSMVSKYLQQCKQSALTKCIKMRKEFEINASEWKNKIWFSLMYIKPISHDAFGLRV